jgi:hypothetical protein
MSKSVISLSICLFVAVVFALLGQHAAGQSLPIHVQQPLPPHPGPVVRAPQAHLPPCWQEAGISKAAMDERAAIGRRTRAEVEAVCAESGLTPQQRQQRIRQIHEQAKQEQDALVTPQQMETLKSCQMSRSHPNPHPGGHPAVGVGRGPCGELPPPKSGPKAPNPTNPPPADKPESEVN